MRKNDYRDYDEDGGCAVGAALGLVLSVFAVSMIILIVFSLSGCSPKTVYIPVENVHTEYRDRENIVSDTTKDFQREQTTERISEKTTVTLNADGDTARTDTRVLYYRDYSSEKENERMRSVIDSLRSVKADTTQVPFPVERKLSKWEQTKISFGGYALGVVAVLVCFIVVWIVRTSRRGR